ncbi:hypothetical protein [uncultured Sneathiella sp.]|uniref:hypothetical protein n=1 Tax=uncultured Sneathiella sp. TaxID=879315 RepID=UPI0030DAEFF1|tara:strand:- start:12 stop:485 length:474 start_codon:yes stop_codon:yes gene_type:complete
MKINGSVLRKTTAKAAVLLATGALLAACGGHNPPPKQVDASSPTVTYKYHSDDELVEVNQQAEAYCRQYNFISRPDTFSTNSDGTKSVVFECVPTATTAANPIPNSDLIYTYRTDQELVNASRSAQAHCASIGNNQVIANIVNNNDGSRTVTFQCRP